MSDARHRRPVAVPASFERACPPAGQMFRSYADKACNLVRGVQPCTMVALLVHLQVKPECIERFLSETTENARNSRKEPGIVRFDLIQEVENPNQFALFELYRDQPAVEAHRLSAHYAKWRDAVPSLLVTERTRKIYRAIEPAD